MYIFQLPTMRARRIRLAPRIPERIAETSSSGKPGPPSGGIHRRRPGGRANAAIEWSVITRDIRSYMSRDWEAARESKDAHWAERIARMGPGEGFRIAEELRRQVLLRNPAWPAEDDRREDLRAHLRLSDLLQRASRPRRG